MKKLLGIFSLSVLLFSTFAPAFTYATEAEEEAKQILEETLKNSFVESDLNNDFSEVIQPNDGIDLSFTLGDYSTYPRIIWNQLSGLITIYTGDFSYGITIQDRNLGAETISDFGNYYKFGVNTIITTGNSSTVSSNNNTNAWGGGQDGDTSDPTIVRGYDTVNHVSTNLLNRRGPCGEGYHVPSAGEINELLKLYYGTKGMEVSIGTNGGSQIYDYNYLINKDLKIVPSGVIAYGSKFDSYYYFQSSSPKENSSSLRYHYYQTSYTVIANGAARDYDYAMPVRCFKNNFVPINEYTPNTRTVTYHPNGGAFSGMEVNEVIEKTYEYGGLEYSQNYNIQIPNRKASEGDIYSGWMFVGWYTKQGNINDPLNSDWGEEFDMDTSTASIVYAKWLPFNDLEISIGDLNFTIMDRNLGAEDIAEGIYSSSSPEDASKLGCYYQWGNNYGHCNSQDLYPKNTTAGTITNVEHETAPRGPNNYYYNNKYILKNDTNRWETEKNLNLRGGEDISSPDYNKKGPCPSGYHIPNETEWKAIYNKINSIKQQDANYCTGEYSDIGLCLAKKLKAPYAGFRDSTLDGKLTLVGYDARYWSSSSDTNSLAFNLLWRDTNIYTSNYTYHTNAIPIRCFKDEGKKIEFIPNGGSEIVDEYYTHRWWEDNSLIRSLPTGRELKLDLLSFDGWYTTENFASGTKVTNNNISSNDDIITLYAKWTDNPKYVYNGNGGKFKDGDGFKSVSSVFIDTGVVTNNPDQNSIIRNVIKLTGAQELYVQIETQRWCTNLINIYNSDITNTDSSEKFREIVIQNGGYITDEFYVPGDVVTIETIGSNNCPSQPYTGSVSGRVLNIVNNYGVPTNPGHEFLGWYEKNSETPFDFENTPITEDRTLYAQWKSLEEKSEETTTENVVYTNNTTVTVGDETTEEVLSGSSTLKLVTEEVKEQEVTAEEDKTTVKESEIKVTSDKKVEYEGGLEVYLEKTENVGMANESTGKVEGTIKFSAPIAVKIPISSDAEYVKVQVKHEGEDFGFKGLTLNPVNECNNGEALEDKYNGEDVEVKGNNGERYATIYTCSASTFVAYTESVKPADPKPSAGGGRVIKQDTKATEQEHNTADLEKDSTTIKTEADNKSTTRLNETVEQKIKKVEGKALTRGEVAVMTNILLEVFPQLIEGNKGLDDVTKACSSYTDEKDFTKDEKKAITRLCKLSIMGIHAEDKTALEEFMVSNDATNDEFNVVVNRAIENYNKKDLATVKEALKKLEGDNEGVVFGTVYDVFMGIKNIFN